MMKLNLQRVIMFFVSLLLFASCMGEGVNKDSRSAVGVVDLDAKTYSKKVLYLSEDFAIYSGRIVNTDFGAYLYVYYEIDYDAPENSYENVEANGYLTASYMEVIQELDQFRMEYAVTDTTKALTNEVAILDPIVSGDLGYVRGKGFFFSFIEIPADQKLYWDLSCDMMNHVKEVYGQRYYDVYLRSYLHPEYPVSTKSLDHSYVLNAFDMRSYLERIALEEKSLGNSTFKLRFNYVSKIDDEILTWGQQESWEIAIDYILTAE